MATTKERMLELLPYYLKSGENINKYYEAIANIFDEILNVFIEIMDSRDIDKSKLYGLDIIGHIVGQLRTEETDSNYKNILKTRVVQNNSQGLIEDINELARTFLRTNFISIEESWSNDIYNEPASLVAEVDGNGQEILSIPQPQLESATAIGVSLRYKVNNNSENIKIIETDSYFPQRYIQCGTKRCGSASLGVLL